MTATTPIAGTLNMLGKDTLYGRYWGATRNVPFLHFELCYYQAIDYAIAHKLTTVEAGAQGEHKLARGYVPTTTHSVHWIGHPGLRDAIARFLQAGARRGGAGAGGAERTDAVQAAASAPPGRMSVCSWVAGLPAKVTQKKLSV